jgi:hypothetical protein
MTLNQLERDIGDSEVSELRLKAELQIQEQQLSAGRTELSNFEEVISASNDILIKTRAKHEVTSIINR